MKTDLSLARAPLAALVLLLAACGSGPERRAPVVPPPVGDAGPDQSVVTGAVVTLDARASSAAPGHALTYAWSLDQRPAGSAAVLSDATAAQPTFAADQEGTYLVALTVRDDAGRTADDTVTITSGPPPDVTAPSVPAQVTASVVSDAGIDVTWRPASDAVGVTGYDLYRDGALLASTTLLSFQDTGLAASSSHCYRVAARDDAGNVSAQSGPSCGLTWADPIVQVGVPVTASRLDGYFVLNTAALPIETNSRLFLDVAAFDATFQGIPGPTRPVPPDFGGGFVVAVVKRGASTWTLDLSGVTLDGTTLRVAYASRRLADNLTWTAAVALIVQVGAVACDRVQFYENGNLAGEVPMP